MRRLEWIGQPAVFDDPVVVYRLTTGGYTEDQARKIRAAARRRNRRVDGVTARELGPKGKGGLRALTRSIVWGPKPGTYVQEVTDEEARVVLESSSGREFIDVTDGKPKGPALLLPQRDLIVVREESHGSLDSYRRSSS